MRQRGFDVLGTGEVRRRGATEKEQLVYATSSGRVLVTHNRLDILRLHADWLARKRPHAGLVILPRSGTVARRSVRVRLLVAWLLDGGPPAFRLVVWGHLQRQL